MDKPREVTDAEIRERFLSSSEKERENSAEGFVEKDESEQLDLFEEKGELA